MKRNREDAGMPCLMLAHPLLDRDKRLLVVGRCGIRNDASCVRLSVLKTDREMSYRSWTDRQDLQMRDGDGPIYRNYSSDPDAMLPELPSRPRPECESAPPL